MNSHSFFKDLESFDQFKKIADGRVFKAAPDDWCIYIADIEKSTEAASDGRYKDVNLIGAACISAATNAVRTRFPDLEIAYVFGGDGATIAAPESVRDLIREAWVQLKAQAKVSFNLNLRAGCVPVAEIRKSGADVTIGRQRLSPGNHLAAFSGGGVSLAEHWIKNPAPDSSFLFSSENQTSTPDLTGLSCRWEPFETRHGVMISILVTATDQCLDTSQIYGKVLDALESVLGRDANRNCPVSLETMRLQWSPSRSQSEALITQGQKPLFWRQLTLLFQSLAHWTLEKLGIKGGSYDAKHYKSEMQANTDYQRFDDALRLVLDCSEDETNRIEEVLEDFFKQGMICYGTHRANHALMTCLVFNLNQSQHVHFIDGGDGGFAVAAQDLKHRRATFAQEENA